MNCIYCLLLKRFFDLSISLVIILFIWPILIFISLWLHFANKGAGAFFLQE
ncbi:sugar transferase, partial [Bacteroides fragilis]